MNIIINHMTTLSIENINTFYRISKKVRNGNDNEIRERIIADIINDNVPKEYYNSENWVKIRNGIFEYIKRLNDKEYIKIECEHKAGRNNYIDFIFIFTYKDNSIEKYPIEFKYNTSSIEDAPQFSSPGKPSNFTNSSYEELFYNEYLPKMASFLNLPIPSKEEYLKQVNSTNPKCMEKYKQLYKTNKEFKNLSNNCFYDSCSKFIENNDLDIEKLSKYLHDTQERKIYMLYKDGIFYIQYNDDNYYIVKVEKGKSVKTNKYTKYICETKNGRYFNVLLRWKNCNGIAFPALQISLVKQRK